MAAETIAATPLTGRIAAVGAVAVLAIAVLFLPDTGSPDAVVTGPATLASGALEWLDGESWNAIEVGDAVPADVPLRAREDGVVLDVRNGTLELTEGARLSLLDGIVTLERGSILVIAPTTWDVVAGGARAVGNGSWRVDGGIAGRAAVYEGAARVTAQNRSLDVPALHEANVVDGGLGAVAAPMRYLSGDDWDRRFLADAIAIDRVVSQLQAGWRAQYPDVPQPAAFYRDFVVGLAGGVGDGVDQAVELLAARRADERFGPPPDVLTGLVFARAVGGSLPDAAAEIVAFRRAGATWGLTAMLLGLDRGDIDAAAEQSLEDRQDAVDAGTAVPPVSSPPPAPTPPPTPTPTPPRPPGPPPTGENPPPPDEPGPGDSLGNVVDELGGLLSGEEDPLTSLGDVLDEVAGLIADTLDELTPSDDAATSSPVEDAGGPLLGGG
ncbi:MAG: hypothetical protein R3249_03460 [Nitriliruptorales bacterium]|nr:hypothetical protein [Nitriliruptorales bacterium]